MDEGARSSPVRRILALGLGCLICLGLLEGIARLVHQPPWYDRLVEEQGRSERHEYRRNRYYLRDHEYDHPKAETTRRILIIGDSFTYGLGVLDFEATFPEILEARLNREVPIPGVDRIEVLNGGIPGSLTGNWVELLRVIGPDFDPDVVLLVFFLRDGTKTTSIPDFFGFIRDEIARRNQESLLYRHLHAYRIVRDRLDRGRVSRLYSERFKNAYFGTHQETGEWRAAQEHLVLLREMARKSQVSVGLSVFPILVDLTGDYPFQDVCDLLEGYCREIDLPVHSLLPAYRGQPGPELWVSPLDQHPNERAHAMAAEALMPFVIRLLESAETGRTR